MSLQNLLNTNKDARKIFGKRELRIIEKQLLGIKLTQSEKNRLSRDIRKKLEFIGEISRFTGEFKLKKGSEIKKMIDESKEIISNNPMYRKINEIVLFGSVVENKLTFKSDIDIAVKFDRIDLKDSTLFRKRIQGRVNKRVNVQVYNHLPEKIRKEIDTKGKVLYKK